MHLYRMPLPQRDDFKDATNELGWLGSAEHLHRQEECEQIVFHFMFNSTFKIRYYFQNFVEMKVVILL